MKIAECTDAFAVGTDGVATVVNAYARVLSKKNHEIYVVAPLDNFGFRGNLPYEIVDFTSIGLSKKYPWKLGLNGIDSHFSERIKQIDLNLVHVHSPGSAGLVGQKIAQKKSIPCIGSFHSKYYDDILKITKSKTLSKFGASIVADFYQKCDEVWAVSQNAADTLKSYGYKGDVIVMQNGLTKRELNSSRIPETRIKYGISDKYPVFLFVGQINWKKNILRILETCALLKSSGSIPNFQLVLTGMGPDDIAIIKKAGLLGLKDNLIMTGVITDTEVLDCLYSIADLFLFPSLYDNSPMVVREAASMKTPSVVVAESGPAEVIEDGINSFVCLDDNKSMAETILKYINMKKEEKQIIKDNACNTIAVPWEGKLMDTIEFRYQELVKNYRKKQ